MPRRREGSVNAMAADSYTHHLDAMEDPLLQEPNQRAKSRKRTIFAIIFLIALAAGVAIAAYVYTTNDSDSSSSPSFSDSVRGRNVLLHLKELDRIATESGGSRAVATGYNASAEYVESVLAERCPHYEVRRQYFRVPIHTELSPPTLSVSLNGETLVLIHETDFAGIRYGGNGKYNVNSLPAKRVSNFGCQASDWPQGEDYVALVAYGGPCHTFDKTLLAESMNEVKATVIHRTNAEKHLSLPIQRSFKLRWTEGDPIIQKPVITTTWSAAGLMEAAQAVSLSTDTQVEMFNTFNIIAEAKRGENDKRRVIVQGSHLDGVPEGPGVNDNGSGTSTNLEIATRFCTAVRNPANHVRFAWWGAEEIGLLGSYHYVASLTQDEKDEIAIAINYDMVASPNGIRGVHNGTQTPEGTPEDVIANSNHLTKLFVNWFTASEQSWESSPMLGGSDFLPFIEAGIPAGGIATGAGGIASMDSREKHGIIANAANDPCYHLPCDTYLNIGVDLLDDIAKAAAHVLHNMAMDRNLFKPE